MSIAPLLLEQLEPGTRVRADGDIIYATDGLEVRDGEEGTVDHPWGVGLSFVRWDRVRERAVQTSHDSLARIEGCLCPEIDASDRPCLTCSATTFLARGGRPS